MKKTRRSKARKVKAGAKSKAGVAKHVAGAKARAGEGKRPGRKRGPKPGTRLQFDWAGVDWQLRDADIARSLGVSRERVRQVRKEKGLPPSSEIGRRPHNWNAVDWSKPDGEIARRMGLTPQRVGRARRSRGVERTPAPVVPRAYAWDAVKWR